MNKETRRCQSCRNDFLIEPDDFDFYKKVRVPPPTFCPDCRLQRRMALRNERSLYKDTCDLCKKAFVSMYSPDKPFTVYCKECWYSDNWDPLQHGREYDWDKPFFTQFRELMERVPRIGIMHIHNNIDSDYANYIADVKNVYLSQSIIAGSENVYYSRNVDKSKEIIDCFNVKESERCYENVDGARNYRVKFAVRSRDCIDSAFLFDCTNCQNCFVSGNLRNRQYVIRNVQYNKEDYAVRLKDENMGTYSKLHALRNEFSELMRHALHRYGNLIKTADCTGNNIDNSKHASDAFDVYNSENIRYAVRVISSKDSYDMTGGADLELVYEQVAGGYGSRNSLFMSHGDVTLDSRYSDWCPSSSNLFGCISLRKKQYCVLSKQYSKEEYEALTKKIIAHMNEMPYKDRKGREYKFGEFFPIELGPFAYNETITEEYFPLTKSEVIAQGYPWRDPDPSPYAPTVMPEKLPDSITETSDSIVNDIIGCACGRAYRIVKPELEFLRREGIALPRTCQECRHKDRFALRNPLKLWHRRCCCIGSTSSPQAGAKSGTGNGNEYKNTAPHFHGADKCPNEFETSYAPERPEVVYCESCYQSEVA